MSVAVELDELWAKVDEVGGDPYLMTVSGEGKPHVVSVRSRVEGDALVADAGRTSRANAGTNPVVTLLWPPQDGGPYCLLVDGEATVDGETVVVRPTRAVLHRLAGAGDGGPSCIPVID